MSKRDPNLLVSDIMESAYKILDYMAGQSFEDFSKDTKTLGNVIGIRIRGFRNRIEHDYFGIDYSIVWIIKEAFLPKMIAQQQPLSKT